VIQKSSSVRGDFGPSELEDELLNLTIGELFNGSEDANVKNLILWNIGYYIASSLSEAETSDALTEPLNTYFAPILTVTWFQLYENLSKVF